MHMGIGAAASAKGRGKTGEQEPHMSTGPQFHEKGTGDTGL